MSLDSANRHMVSSSLTGRVTVVTGATRCVCPIDGGLTA